MERPDSPECVDPSRSPEPEQEDPIERAREYGIDISLLHSNLLRTPEERLRIASHNAEFIRRVRGAARK